jgi:hypothetical protein
MIGRILAGFSAAMIALSLVGCEPVLIYNKQVPEFKAPADKALCVVIRPMALTGSKFVPIYCDTQYVGGTEGNTVLSFPVTPGEHFIIGDGTNKSKVKYNFQAGKVYFINHTVVVITTSAGPVTITITTSTFKPKSGSEAMEKLESEKGKITWVQPNPANPQENLKAGDFADAKKDWEKWAAESKNAADLQIEKDYPGY